MPFKVVKMKYEIEKKKKTQDTSIFPFLAIFRRVFFLPGCRIKVKGKRPNHLFWDKSIYTNISVENFKLDDGSWNLVYKYCLQGFEIIKSCKTNVFGSILESACLSMCWSVCPSIYPCLACVRNTSNIV